MELKNFIKKYDPKSEAKWYEYQEGIKFLVAPMRNAEMKKQLLQEFTLSEAIKIEEEGATGLDGVANVALGRLNRVYSKSLIVDWEGLTEDEKPIKYSSDKIHEWLMEDDAFNHWMLEKANEVLLKKYEQKEEVLKN